MCLQLPVHIFVTVLVVQYRYIRERAHLFVAFGFEFSFDLFFAATHGLIWNDNFMNDLIVDSTVKCFRKNS